MYGEKAAAMVQRLEQATWLPPYDDTMREVLTEIDELPLDESEIREQRAEAGAVNEGDKKGMQDATSYFDQFRPDPAALVRVVRCHPES